MLARRGGGSRHPRPSLPIDPTLQARTLTTPHRCSSTIGSSLLTCGVRVGDPVRGMGFDGVIGLPDTDLETVRAPEAPTTCPSAPTPRSSAGQRRLWSRDVPGHGRRLARLRRRSPVVFTWPCWVRRCTRRTSCSPSPMVTRSCRTPPALCRTGSSTSETRWSSSVTSATEVRGKAARSTRPSSRSWTTAPRCASSGLMAKSGVGLTWEGQAPRATAPGRNSSGPSSTMSAMRLPAKVARASSNGRCCPTTSSRSTAAVTSACACSPRVASPRLGSPGSPPTPTNTTSECRDRRGRFDRPALRERGRLQGRRGHAASPGLADLGQPLGDGVVYDDCYAEDVDNQIDIIGR